MQSELESRIQQLCREIVATNDTEKLDRLCHELRQSLSDYIGALREEVKRFGDTAKHRSSQKEGS